MECTLSCCLYRVDPGVRQVVEPSHIQVPTYDSGNKVEGKLPEDYEHQAAYSSFANEVFGLQSQRHLNRLVDYLRMNGPFELVPVNMTGACMFAS